MHIAVDCRCVHAHMGGIGRAALELVRAMDRASQGHRLTMILGQDPGTEVQTQHVSLIKVDAAMIDQRFEQIQLPSLLAELQVDCYLNTTFSIPAIKTTKFQTSIIHDVVFEDRPDYVEPGLRAYLSRWSRFAAAEADHLFTVSDHARDRIRQVYGVDSTKITRVYNGIPQSCFIPPSPHEVERVRAKFRLARPFLLYLGTIEAKKGVAELLSAFRILRQSGFGGALVLAGGKGGDTKDLEREMKAERDSAHIRFLGYIDDADKKPLLKAASCFVYPSLYEGFGLPPLEAMALGVPCVVSNLTSLPEVVGDSALTAPVQDPDAFAATLAKALKDPETRSRAQTAGPARARTFTWEDAASHILKTCQRLGDN